MVPLPIGPRVSFLFTDIEGSTRAERAAGSVAWATIVARHDELLRRAIEGHLGVVVKTEGDAFFAAFEHPEDAAAAAVVAQRAVAGEAWPAGSLIRVRMGLHLGEGRLRQGLLDGAAEDYVGIDVNYAARITAVGNGGQIVVSEPFAAALGPILGSSPELAGTQLVDDGLRSVKDFDEPAALHRLVVPGAADDSRRLRTLEPPSNLPGEVTELVGRGSEIEALEAILAASRIVTLTGPGGSGKTRLALGVARASAERFPHGTWFVDLAGLRDPRLLESVVASTLGVRESSERTAADALRIYLRDRIALLVLDNLEQLLPAGADIVSGLVRDAPQVRVLVTSRELLRIGGERGYPVPPLDLEAGIALFVERAQAHRPDLVLGGASMSAIRAICERLGGLPLAIELAAARTRLLSPEGILDRLGHSLDLAGGARDVPERQRTLRAAIGWSHDLLSEPEQRLFRRLSVFVGGWSLDAAQLVTDPAGDLGMDLFDGLESLADKSLIQVEPGPAGEPQAGPPADEIRYGLHPLLREFGLERLADSHEAAEVEARHAAVTAEIAERAGGSILGPSGEAGLRALDREESNVRAAIGWSLAHAQPAVGMRILGATWRWYQQRGRLREGRALLAELLPADQGEDVAARIAGLTADGGLAYWMEDFGAARRAYDERLELARSTGDPGTIADADYDLGFLSMVAQDGPQLLEHEQRALELYQQAGRADGVIRARQGLVLAHYLSGEFGQARDLELDNNAGFRQAGSAIEVADSALLLAAIFLRLGDPVSAWEQAVEGLRLFAGNDLASGLARSLGIATIIQLEHGDPEFGARLAGSTMELVREKGVMLAPVKVLHLPDPTELAERTLGPERAAELMAVGASTARPEMVAAVLATSPPTS